MRSIEALTESAVEMIDRAKQLESEMYKRGSLGERMRIQGAVEHLSLAVTMECEIVLQEAIDVHAPHLLEQN